MECDVSVFKEDTEGISAACLCVRLMFLVSRVSARSEASLEKNAAGPGGRRSCHRGEREGRFHVC